MKSEHLHKRALTAEWMWDSSMANKVSGHVGRAMLQGVGRESSAQRRRSWDQDEPEDECNEEMTLNEESKTIDTEAENRNRKVGRKGGFKRPRKDESLFQINDVNF